MKTPTRHSAHRLAESDGGSSSKPPQPSRRASAKTAKAKAAPKRARREDGPPGLKLVAVGSATIDVIAVAAPGQLERAQLENAGRRLSVAGGGAEIPRPDDLHPCGRGRLQCQRVGRAARLAQRDPGRGRRRSERRRGAGPSDGEPGRGRRFAPQRRGGDRRVRDGGLHPPERGDPGASGRKRDPGAFGCARSGLRGRGAGLYRAALQRFRPTVSPRWSSRAPGRARWWRPIRASVSC